MRCCGTRGLAVAAVIAAIVFAVLEQVVQVPTAGRGEAGPERTPVQPPAYDEPVRQVEVPSGEFSASSFATPPLSDHPWTRWWWPGSAVAEGEVRRQLKTLREVGIRGVEVQAMTWGLVSQPGDAEFKETRGYLSAQYNSAVRTAVETANSLGMKVDLALGSSWPSGSSSVSASDGMWTLVHSEARAVRGGGGVAIPPPQPPLTYRLMKLLGMAMGPGITGWAPWWFGADATPVAVVSSRVVKSSWLGALRSWCPSEAGRFLLAFASLRDTCVLDAASLSQLPLKSLRRTPDGGWWLDWEPPEGVSEALVVVAWQLPVGEHPIAASQEPAGYVTDALSSDKVTNLMDEILGHHVGVNGVHIDSFEFKAERHWTPGFIDVFKQRRGYDPTRFLPALFAPGADHYVFTDGFRLPTAPSFELRGEPADLGDRLRYDWDLTTSELMVSATVDTAREWVKRKGMRVRVQGYGANIDVIAALGRADVPETEMLLADGVEAFLRIAGSAACLYRRPLASAEAMISHKLAYGTTPTHLRAGVNKLAASGINLLVYHGTPYRNASRDPRYGETGWFPFASPSPAWLTMSEDFSEGNSALWGEPFRALNTYVARVQHIMRLGLPEADVLAFYPWLGTIGATIGRPEGAEVWAGGYVAGLDDPPSDPFGKLGEVGRRLVVSDGNETKQEWHRVALKLLRHLEAAGAQWVWANGDSLRLARCSDGAVVVRGAHYRAVVVPAGTAQAEPEVAEALAKLVSDGCIVHLADGSGPSRQPGLHEHQAGDARVAAAFARCKAPGDSPAKLLKRMATVRLPHSETAAVLQHDTVEAPEEDKPQPPPVTTARRLLADGSRVTLFANHLPVAHNVEAHVPPGARASWADPVDGTTEVARGGILRRRLHPFAAVALVVQPPRGTDEPAVQAERGTDDAAEVEVVAVPTPGWKDWRLTSQANARGPVQQNLRVSVPAGSSRAVLDLGRVCAMEVNVTLRGSLSSQH
eukprot:Hpha_TRINITY_DN1802_c0_g2::TRINITY_DN1802_c0_g2_i1::g.170623::m.170623